MPAFLPPPSDDALALMGCGAALLVSVLTLQFVHFIQHRHRPESPLQQCSRLPSDSARTRSLHDSAA